MYEVYNKLFNIYLKSCTLEYDPNHPYDNLEKCCNYVYRIKYELLGMLNLMEEMKVITYKQNEMEWQRIIKKFSTYDLFNCYKAEDGEILMWYKKQ